MPLRVHATIVILLSGCFQASPDTGTVTRKQGFISLLQVPSTSSFTVSAAFLESTTDLTRAAPCEMRMRGSCTSTRCDGASSSSNLVTLADGGLALTPLNAGTLSVSGLTASSAQSLTIDAEEPGFRYLRNGENALLWREGDVISVETTGAQVPVFRRTVTGPAALTVSTPVCSNAQCGIIRRDRPLTVTWAPVSAGSANVSLRSRSDKQGVRVDAQVVCIVPAREGVVTIPTELLGTLAQVTDGNLSVRNVNTSSFAADSVAIELVAESSDLSATVAFQE